MTEIMQMVSVQAGRIQRVLDLHEPQEILRFDGQSVRQICRECQQSYPCNTIKALDGDTPTESA